MPRRESLTQAPAMRMAAFFREASAIQVRVLVEAVAQQRSFMRRIRADSGSGTRGHLAAREFCCCRDSMMQA